MSIQRDRFSCFVTFANAVCVCGVRVSISIVIEWTQQKHNANFRSITKNNLLKANLYYQIQPIDEWRKMNDVEKKSVEKKKCSFSK